MWKRYIFYAHMSLAKKPGRLGKALIFKSEDLPAIGTKDHGELVRYKSCFTYCEADYYVYPSDPLAYAGGFFAPDSKQIFAHVRIKDCRQQED